MNTENTNSPINKEQDSTVKNRPTVDSIKDKLLESSVNVLDDLVEVAYDEAKSGIQKLLDWINCK